MAGLIGRRPLLIIHRKLIPNHIELIDHHKLVFTGIKVFHLALVMYESLATRLDRRKRPCLNGLLLMVLKLVILKR